MYLHLVLVAGEFMFFAAPFHYVGNLGTRQHKEIAAQYLCAQYVVQVGHKVGLLLVELVVDGLKAITVDVDDEYLGEGEHHVGMSEGLGVFLFFEHSAHDDVEDVGCRFVDGEAGFAVVGVEHAIFDEHVFSPVAPADDVGAEAEDYTFAAHGIVKEMYLSWGYKQECVLFHLILVKVQGVCASCFPEP